MSPSVELQEAEPLPVAPALLITSSTSASTFAGMSRPIALAVLRLRMNGYLTVSCTGRSRRLSHCPPRACRRHQARLRNPESWRPKSRKFRSEEHTSELQSLTKILCRLLLEKKKTNKRPRP